MSRLAGRSAIVTGGAIGIGRHYSQALADAGAQVVIADIVDGAEAADAITAKHGRDAALAIVFDVSDENSVKMLVERTLERFGKIDILVNNAAIFAQIKPTRCIDLDVETWDKVMAVNVRGPFLMAKHVAPHMMARRYGKIINIGSGSASRGMPEMLHYVSSKGAILGFTRALCRELGDYGICVNTLAPGYTLSETALQNATHLEQSRTISIQRRAIKRDQYPEDLLGALVFLASSDSDFITGQTIAVDGGATNT
jgi:NAD(P)-dependent dehydrogenase (short-subunit alcohol dehydrogenase family)